MSVLSEEDQVKILREEVYNVKQCYTNFSFHSLTFSTAALGLIFGLQKSFPLIGLACVFIFILLLLVVRIGIHKFETANRLAGFELYLQRMQFLKSKLQKKNAFIVNIGMEEAFYVWRIIQPSLYRKMYIKPKRKFNFWTPTKINKNRLKGKEPNILYGFNLAFADKIREYDADIHYDAGGYLRKTHNILHLVAGLSLTPLIILTIQIWYFGIVPNVSILGGLVYLPFAAKYAVLCLTAILLLVLVGRVRRVAAKRKILETGMLSINSCAIIWRVIATAHSKALYEIFSDEKSDNFRGYTSSIITQLSEILKNCDDIYSYITPTEET